MNYDLDTPILKPTAVDQWTARNAVEGVQIFGGIGSGKSSGSGQKLALKYLRQGFGGLVLTVKPDEWKEWVKYCDITNRSQDLIILEPGGRHSFNFLDYEAKRKGIGAGLTDNLVMILKTVIHSGQAEQRSNEAFWDDALDMLLFSVLDLCLLAFNRLNIDDIHEVVNALPKNPKKLQDKEWRKKNAFAQAYFHAKTRMDNLKMSIADSPAYKAKKRSFDSLVDYFGLTWLDLSDRTRSVIEHSFHGLLFRLTRDPIYSLMCSQNPNIKPDDSIDGKIFLINLPVKEYDKVGRDAQILFKYVWQRAMERRRPSEDGGRPVFLWADEAQNFIHEHDIDYQATARSSRVCTVYLTQNLPNYYSHMGGRDGEYQVKSFLGTMGTKIFHANSDYDTNSYASELIGEVYVEDSSRSFSTGQGTPSISRSTSRKLERQVRPEQIVSLKTGGPANQFLVQAILQKQGMPFQSNDLNYLKIELNQQLK